MTFTSLSYFLFLPLIYLVFYLVADRFRWSVLLLGSYAFYATFKAPQLLLILALVTCISYSCGLRLGATTDEVKRIRLLWLGVAACLALLVVIKYLPPLLTGITSDSPYHGLLISIGVSYFSFQAVSYLADVYLEIQEPEGHFGHHALALAFFPKLLQGPIERAGDLLPQLQKPYVFDYDAMRSGMLLFAFGLFKKVVVADHFALYANTVYNDVHTYAGLPLFVGTYAYALQIYFDFSGYTDMARGTARLFGIELTENFHAPYLATSIADFWRRWHISFSRWILDYIFKPLQMSWRNRGQAGAALALLVTFLVSGIWHGASWGFVVWGVLHGSYLAASTYYRPYQKRLHKRLGARKGGWITAWQVCVTFNLVSFAWIFFRAGSLSDAWYVVSHLFAGGKLEAVAGKAGFGRYLAENIFLGHGDHNFIVTVVALCAYFAVVRLSGRVQLFGWPTPVRWFAYGALLNVIVFFGVFRGDNFVYFKF